MCELKEDYHCNKLSSKVDVRYFWNKTLALGNITDVSKSCMCIDTEFCFPLNSRIELLVPCRRNVVAILAQVNRYSERDSLCRVMNVEILDQNREFLEFVKSLQKRRYKRINLALGIELVTKELTCAAFTNNVSEKGLSITFNPLNASSDIKTGAKFEIKFPIPPGDEKVSLFSEKRWSSTISPEGLTKVFGIEIIDPPKEYKEFVNTLK